MKFKLTRESWMTVAISVVLAALIAHQTRAYRPPTGPTKPGITAVLDLQKTINALDEYHAAVAELQKNVNDLQNQAGDMLKSVKQMKADLDDLQIGSDKYKALEEKLELALNEYQGFQELVKRKAVISSNKTITTIYLNVKDAVKQIATDNDYSVVLVDDSVIEVNPDEDIMKQIAARKLVFTAAEADITQMVVDRMNAEFKARQPKGAAAAP